MRTLLISSSPRFAENLMLALENLDESWQVRWQSTLPTALHAELLLLASPQNPSLMAELFAHPPLPAAYLLTLGGAASRADTCLPADTPLAQIVLAAQELSRMNTLPLLARSALPDLIPRAEALLREMGLKPTLRAAAFLPEMIAVCAACPWLLDGVTQRLYPLIGQSRAMQPAAVERSVRSALDSLWRSGSLSALEKWFGHTVDPEKGRPTNREFLALMAEHVRDTRQS